MSILNLPPYKKYYKVFEFVWFSTHCLQCISIVSKKKKKKKIELSLQNNYYYNLCFLLFCRF